MRFTTKATPRTAAALSAVALVWTCTSLMARADKPPANPVQLEMRALETAMKATVTAVANGDVTGLPKLFHKAHMAGGDVSASLREGRYKTPQNGDDVKGFMTLDASFHSEMIKLVKAARQNDVPTVAERFGDLMVRCNQCHAVYRHPKQAAARDDDKKRKGQ